MNRPAKYALRGTLALVLLTAGIVAYVQFENNVRDWYIDRTFERKTALVATEQPDQLCLTWSGAPQTTQTVQWRTSTAVEDGWVQWRVKDAGPETAVELPASRAVLEDKMLINDPVIHRFTCVMTGLRPATLYTYRAGSKQKNTWTEWADFTTAPDTIADFSFNYLGDPQLGLEYWGKLIGKANEQYSAAAFYVVAGDLVNSGSWRNEWDKFFDAGKDVFNQRPIVPVLGNHDYDKKSVPRLYLESFAVHENGPPSIGPERAYSFMYSNALFVVLDSNRDLHEQTPWLEQQLKNSKATWKFAAYHHPSYPSAPHRENAYVRDTWGELFDRYHVDIAFTGHDHAYLRTFPMRDNARVASAEDGTYYIVSVSGKKYYEQEPHTYADVAFANVSTYQIIDITTNPDRLAYRCYDFDGVLRDELIIEK
ncbi:MAG: metallophosphoesterase family protein [Candidatus Hydrogenedentes bacterium]|nr:metallophosphoesterase family protein [Candidatus Hydrogenedentota bacterium]